MTYSLIQIKAVIEKKGYEFFDDGTQYNLNIVSVRKDNKVPDSFDDELYLVYRDNYLQMQIRSFPVTTDPGLKILLKPIAAKGTAILVPNQYKNAYTIRKHRGKYDALCQEKPVTVWRDDNQNEILDFECDVKDSGRFGINIHRSNALTESTVVGGWSAGCTVFKRVNDFYFFMKQAYKYRDTSGINAFTYTLITEQDFMDIPSVQTQMRSSESQIEHNHNDDGKVAKEVEKLNNQFLEILDLLNNKKLANFLLAEREGLTQTVEMLLADLKMCKDSNEKKQLVEDLTKQKEQLSLALDWYKKRLLASDKLPPIEKIIEYISKKNKARHNQLGKLNKRVAMLELQQ